MGYNISFEGVIGFKKEPSIDQLNHLATFLGKDRRQIGFADDNEVYVDEGEYWYHIDLELTEKLDGVQWNQAEKTKGMVEIFNWLTVQMRKKWSDFEFVGEMKARGDERDDYWKLVIVNGKAVEIDYKGVEFTDRQFAFIKECITKARKKYQEAEGSEVESLLYIEDLENLLFPEEDEDDDAD